MKNTASQNSILMRSSVAISEAENKTPKNNVTQSDIGEGSVELRG